MSWIDEFEEKLRDSLENDSPVVSPTTGGQAEVKSTPAEPSSKKSNSLNLFLFALLLIVFVVIAFQFRKDKLQDINNYWNDWNSWNQVEPRPIPEVEPNEPKLEDDPTVLSLQKELDELQERYEKISEKNELYQKRMTLLAIINNNNWCVIKNNYSKRDLIYLNGDWTIDQMPKHVEFDKEDEEFIKQFIR